MPSGREALAALGGAPEAPEEPTTPPLRPVGEGFYLALDQALSNTGGAFLRGWKGEVRIVGTFHWKAKPADFAKGHPGNLQRAELLWDRLSTVLTPANALDGVIYATPPAGGRLSRPESALLGANTIRLLARLVDTPAHMVSDQHARKVLAGIKGNTKGDVAKKEMRAWVEQHVGRDGSGPWNYDVTDAVALGVCWMVENTEERDG